MNDIDIDGFDHEDLPELPLSEYDLIHLDPAPPENPSKTGPKGKRLVAVEVEGYQIGRGINKRFITPDDVYKLAALGSNDREIALWFDVNEDTLRYNFSDIIAKGREDLKHSLRRAQIKLALSGNAVMLIWLGKNILGQTDSNIQSEANAPLPWSEEE